MVYKRSLKNKRYRQWYDSAEQVIRRKVGKEVVDDFKLDCKKETLAEVAKVVNAIGKEGTITREQLAAVFATVLDSFDGLEDRKEFMDDCLKMLNAA